MTEQYLREASVIIGAKDGHALDLSALRFAFFIRDKETGTPKSADIRIYNPAPATVARTKSEFTRVVVQAGYKSNAAVIFDGTIIQARYGRENQVDTFLDLVAQDGDEAHNYAVVSTTLAAGYRNADVNKALTASMAPHGVTQGYAPDLGGTVYPRGRVLYGMARDHMQDLSRTTNTSWNISGGQSVLVGAKEYLPGQAVVVNASTGMIGLPVQSQDGIAVRMLLNPRLKAHVQLKIDNAAIQLARRDPAYGGDAAFSLIPTLDSDGFYRILAVDHVGDTRGRQWYSDVIAVGLTSTVGLSLSQTSKGRT